jgi:hypothetical protein
MPTRQKFQQAVHTAACYPWHRQTAYMSNEMLMVGNADAIHMLCYLLEPEMKMLQNGVANQTMIQFNQQRG